MLKFLSVERSNYKKKNGTIRKDLPYQLRSIEEISDNSIHITDKLMILLEQAILSRSILDMVPNSTLVVEYLNRLQKYVYTVLPVRIDSMDSTIYRTYVETIKGVIIGDKKSIYDSLDMLRDEMHFSKESKMLPKAFYEPYLLLAGNRNNANTENYISPVLLLPSVRKVSGGLALVFEPKTFLECKLNKNIVLPDITPLQSYLLKMDWSTQKFEQFIEVYARYGSIVTDKFDASRSMAGSVFYALVGKLHKSIISKPLIVKFEKYLQYMFIENKWNLESFDSMIFLQSNLGYSDLQFLVSAQPTNSEMVAFEQYSELQFLKSYKLQAALEAEGEEAKESEEPDDLEDDPETNPDDESTEETTPDTGENDSDDEGTDDAGMDDTGEAGTDETADSSSSSDSGDTNVQTETDTPEEIEDPLGMIFEISNSETTSEYFQRQAIVKTLNAMVNSPSPEMSSSTVSFLRVWLSQWVHLVSLNTTKSVLSQLAIKIDI